MPLLKLTNVSLHYGKKVLLDEANLVLRRGNRIGILGRNGEGKTTLLKVIAGEIAHDGGERWVRPGVRISWLAQELPDADEQSVDDAVASGLAEAGRPLSQYHGADQEPDPAPEPLEPV